MAYEFALMGTRRGEQRLVFNPFTGQSAMMTTPAMSDDERAAVRAVFARHGATLDAGSGTIALAGAAMRLEDLGGLRSVVIIEGLIEQAIGILFEIATAGRLVVMNDHVKCDDPGPVVTTAEAQTQANASDPDGLVPELVTDLGTFLRVLLPGYDRLRAANAS